MVVGGWAGEVQWKVDEVLRRGVGAPLASSVVSSDGWE